MRKSAGHAEDRPVVVVENEPAAGIGRFGTWLADAGLAVEVCRPHAGEPVPAHPTGRGLIVLGGPMGAHDDHRAPWLPATRALLRLAVATDTPTLGICLGAQLLAAALGGVVESGAAGPQTGVTHVAIAHPDDPLVRGITSPATFIQWHFDAIARLPPPALPIARSDENPSEVFRIGRRAWGVSFHPEAEFSSLEHWADLTTDQLAEHGIHADSVVGDVRHHQAEITAASCAIATNFIALMTRPD